MKNGFKESILLIQTNKILKKIEDVDKKIPDTSKSIAV